MTHRAWLSGGSGAFAIGIVLTLTHYILSRLVLAVFSAPVLEQAA